MASHFCISDERLLLACAGGSMPGGQQRVRFTTQARQLLLIQDALQANEFPLTQEFLAQILGTRRSGVTVAAGALNSAGMIRYSRGRLTILQREGLEATTCECYGVIRSEFNRLFDQS